MTGWQFSSDFTHTTARAAKGTKGIELENCSLWIHSARTFADVRGDSAVPAVPRASVEHYLGWADVRAAGTEVPMEREAVRGE